MKVRMLVIGLMLAGLLVALNITFGQSDDLPVVPVEEDMVAATTGSAAAVEEAVAVLAEPMPETDALENETMAEVESIEIDTTPPDVGGYEVGGTGEDLITISLDNAPLVDVVRMFSRISGANIVSGTNLVGSVTVSMHDVPWEPALRAILDSVNLVLVEKTPGIYSIISKAELAAEPVATETMFLSYTSVSNVLPVVQQMLIATNATASGFPSANAIVVQETASRLNEIRRTVNELDKPRPQVYIETKFIELNDQAIEDLGVNWQVLQAYTVGVTPGFDYLKEDVSTRRTSDTSEYVSTRQSNRERNDVLYDASGGITDTGYGDFDARVFGRNALPSFVPPKIERAQDGTIVSEEPPRLEFNDVLPKSANTSSDSLVETFTRTLENIDDVNVTKLYSAVLTADELAVTLSALKQQDGVEVVSNPKIIVANGETARIHVGINTPNVSAVPTGDTGDRFAVQLDDEQPYIETGVKLRVTPTVNTEENIGIKIIPELSRILGSLDVGSVGVSYPITSVRTIETEFQLESGRTVAIGGLTESSDQESINKIPLLGDIPVIGKYLFSHRHMETKQDEVVIFVTVGLASPQSLVEVTGIPSGGQLIHRHLANQAAMEAGLETP